MLLVDFKLFLIFFTFGMKVKIAALWFVSAITTAKDVLCTEFNELFFLFWTFGVLRKILLLTSVANRKSTLHVSLFWYVFRLFSISHSYFFRNTQVQKFSIFPSFALFVFHFLRVHLTWWHRCDTAAICLWTKWRRRYNFELLSAEI